MAEKKFSLLFQVSILITRIEFFDGVLDMEKCTLNLKAPRSKVAQGENQDSRESEVVIHPLTGLVINAMVHKAHRVGLSKLEKVPPLHATRK